MSFADRTTSTTASGANDTPADSAPGPLEPGGPGEPGAWALPAAVRETHVGVVVLLGDRAYKLKKPVSTPYLDFSTPERRLAACRRELELNRRLAPDVYLGLAHVSGECADSHQPAEPMLLMRRSPMTAGLPSWSAPESTCATTCAP